MSRHASLSDFNRLFQKKKLEPIYFFFGEEDFLIEEALSALKSALFSSELEQAANTVVLYGPDISLGTIVSVASEYSMFSERRLVIVRQFEKVRKESSKDKQAAHLTEFLRYLQDPLPTTTLVLVAGALNRQELKKEPFMWLEKMSYEFAPLKSGAEFAEQYAARLGWRLTPEAARNLDIFVGNSTRELGSEIQKIINYVGSRNDQTITGQDVLNVVAVLKEYDVFALQKAIAERDLRQASGIALKILEKEGTLMPIINYFAAFFTKLWKLKSPAVLRMNDQDAAKEIGLFGGQIYFLKEYRRYAEVFSISDIERALLALHKADLALKGITPQLDEPLLTLDLIQKLVSNTQTLTEP
ncbi:MAG: DNA polymerase III subunit delta [Chloroherpetonaceae bacterium]|nr:DNA polymerase III subunit delta [Chloroherpetonaceae bacterium]